MLFYALILKTEAAPKAPTGWVCLVHHSVPWERTRAEKRACGPGTDGIPVFHLLPLGERPVMPAAGLGRNVAPKRIHSLMNSSTVFYLTPYKRSYFVEKSILKLVWSLSSKGKCRINCWLSPFGKSWILSWAQVGRRLGPLGP